MTGFVEVAPDVYVLRYPVLDVNSTLIVGAEVGVLVDTLSTDGQAAELLAAVRAVTSLPLLLVNTHWHFDHCFGNSAIERIAPGGGIWAHEAAIAELREHGERHQREWYTGYLASDPELAQALSTVEIRTPERPVHGEALIDIGGGTVELRHFGRGHTEGDLVALVADAGVLVAGDLIEQGAPPDFADAYPLEWPETLAAMLEQTPAPVLVPGHGSTVDLDFARAQHEELATLAWLIREGDADGAAPDVIAAKAPFGPAASLVAVKRGYAELSGRL
jgi:glyoxylase-like metal-dependent hydrolase (beta-lactamase superfamily II)